MRHLIKCLLPLCILGFGLGCSETEQGYEQVEVGDQPEAIEPVEEKPDGMMQDEAGAD